MPSPARIQETLIGWGFKKQADIATANVLAGIWSMSKLNAALNMADLGTEDDADEIGKGHEFPTITFNTAWDVKGTIEKYCSSDLLAWIMAFGLGKVVKSGTTPNFTYTCTPLNTTTDGIELPYFSFLEQIRPGGSSVVDRMAVGCSIEDFTVSISNGPSRANSKAVVNFVGSGLLTQPSAIALPAVITEKMLPAASLAFSAQGTDYVANKNIVSVDFGFKNNLSLNEGFFPGSGFQSAGVATSGSIRGRQEVGKRMASLKFIARFVNGSPELTALSSQSTGTVTLTLTYDANNSLAVTFQKVSYRKVDLTDTNGLVTATVECNPEYHPSNGLLSVVAKCNTDNIGQ